ncbi:MAG: TIGR01244 family sulfur transferase [Allosphingosinicella sp.]
MTFRRLDETMLVSPAQVRPEDMAAVAALGVATLINNRPDAEEAGQPSSAEVEAAARAAGLDYRHIPFSGGSRAEIEAMAEALDAGPALAFCRSGTRSTYLWALARAARGADPAALVRQAAEAGYDLSPILRLLAR